MFYLNFFRHFCTHPEKIIDVLYGVKPLNILGLDVGQPQRLQPIGAEIGIVACIQKTAVRMASARCFCSCQ